MLHPKLSPLRLFRCNIHRFQELGKRKVRACSFQGAYYSSLQFARILMKKQIRMARMAPNEANKKLFVIIRVMGLELSLGPWNIVRKS